jgi:translation initiation factor 5B
MAPKKKGGRKQEEDWEAELGESIPTNGEAEEQPAEEAPKEEESSGMGGGLLAALKKNKTKKAKKGRADNDWVEGEDPTQEANGSADLASKEPEEANFDDDDVFAGNAKPKVVAKPAGKAAKEPPKPADDDSKVKSKKEKEKEKKEREKQRKKEQVCFTCLLRISYSRC